MTKAHRISKTRGAEQPCNDRKSKYLPDGIEDQKLHKEGRKRHA